MKLVVGNKYQWWYEGIWIYDGLRKGDYKCDDCEKPRQKLHWFHAQNSPNEILKLGMECVKEMGLAP